MVGSNELGYFPYTPSTNLLYRLNEAIDILREEGLENVFAGHADHGAAVKFWGLEVLCAKQGQESGVLTVVLMAYCLAWILLERQLLRILMFLLAKVYLKFLIKYLGLII